MHKVLQNLPYGGVFLHRHGWRFEGGLPNIEQHPPAVREIRRSLARLVLVRTGRNFSFDETQPIRGCFGGAAWAFLRWPSWPGLGPDAFTATSAASTRAG